MNVDLKELKRELQAGLISQIDFSRDIDDNELYDPIDEMIIASSKTNVLTLSDMEYLRRKLFDALRKLDVPQWGVWLGYRL